MIQTQVKGVAAHMKQARAWTSVEVTERLAAQPPPPPCVPRVPLREMRRVDGVGRRGDCVGGPLRRWRGGRHSVDGVEVPRGRTRRDATPRWRGDAESARHEQRETRRRREDK